MFWTVGVAIEDISTLLQEVGNGHQIWN